MGLSIISKSFKFIIIHRIEILKLWIILGIIEEISFHDCIILLLIAFDENQIGEDVKGVVSELK